MTLLSIKAEILGKINHNNLISNIVFQDIQN